MTTRILTAAATLLAALVVCSPASAHTIQGDIAAAQAYWGTDVCRDQWQIIPDATLPARGFAGEATGLTVLANGEWFIARCEFTIDPGLKGCGRRFVIAHEIGHFVHGPSHTGPMEAFNPAAFHDGNAICERQVVSRTTTGAVKAKVRKKLRSARYRKAARRYMQRHGR